MTWEMVILYLLNSHTLWIEATKTKFMGINMTQVKSIGLLHQNKQVPTLHNDTFKYFLPARIRRIPAGTQSHNSVCLSMCVCMSAVISSSSSSSVNEFSLEEGSSRTCVGAVPRDITLYDIMSGIR